MIEYQEETIINKRKYGQLTNNSDKDKDIDAIDAYNLNSVEI